MRTRHWLWCIAGTLLSAGFAPGASAGQEVFDFFFGGDGATGSGVFQADCATGVCQVESAHGTFQSLPFTLTASVPGFATDNIFYDNGGFPFDIGGMGLATSQYSIALACGSIDYETPTCELIPSVYLNIPGWRGYALLNFQAVQVPEPGPAPLWCLGFAALTLTALRRRATSRRAVCEAR
jgi:hypothetical protein